MLAVIPARAGSKEIPGKNRKRIGPYNLVEHAVRAAKGCNSITHILLSTDDKEIQAECVAKHWCPLRDRPAELAADSTEMSPVILDALQYGEVLWDTTFGFVIILQPTSPFRNTEDIAGCIRLLQRADTVYTQCRDPIPIEWHNDAMGMPIVAGTGPIQNRQKLGTVYVRNGAVYGATRAQVLTGELFGNVRLGYIMPEERSININDHGDLARAREYYNARHSGSWDGT